MGEKNYLCVGKIVGTHGIHGEIKVDSFCDYPEIFYDICNFFTDKKGSALDITGLRVHKSQVLVQLKEVNDRNTAEKFRGKYLYALKKDIPIDKDRYFIEDLKGCKVIDSKTEKNYGILKDVFNTGASDIYSIVDSQNREYLVPIIAGTVQDIDLENNQIFISPIAGVFDE